MKNYIIALDANRNPVGYVGPNGKITTSRYYFATPADLHAVANTDLASGYTYQFIEGLNVSFVTPEPEETLERYKHFQLLMYRLKNEDFLCVQEYRPAIRNYILGYANSPETLRSLLEKEKLEPETIEFIISTLKDIRRS
jgi:hypothetical protein